LKEFKGNLKDFEGNLKDFEGNLKDFEGILKDFEGNLKDFEGNLKDFEGILNDFEGNFKETWQYFEENANPLTAQNASCWADPMNYPLHWLCMYGAKLNESTENQHVPSNDSEYNYP
jgi:uncharacterized protein YjbJ (UPF0337 family)